MAFHEHQSRSVSHVPIPRPVRGRRSIRAFSPIRAVGRLRQRWWDEDQAIPRWQGWWWTILLFALLIAVAGRLGATDWYTDLTITGVDGRVYRVPETYLTHDHPFHLAKEQATLNALRDGWLPHWFSFHMAGFPAEYYPTGGDVLVAAVYALGFGQIPLEIAHKLVVIAVFMVPPLAFWPIVRRDRLPLSMAVLVAALHLFVPGNWLGGGGDGLFRLGVWPDIFAGYLALPFILWFADYLRFSSRRGFVLATLCGALAVYTNPRSILYFAAAFVAVVAIASVERFGNVDFADGSLRDRERATRSPDERAIQRPSIVSWTLGQLNRPLLSFGFRAVHVPILIGLLSASLLVPLRANQDDYAFAHFVEFENFRHIWTVYQEAMPVEIIGLAGVGLIIAVLRRGFYGRVFALLLPLSYAAIALISGPLQEFSFFRQLEATRLIPMLRPATLFLAALALHEVPRSLFRRAGARGATVITGITMLALTSVALLTSHSPIPEGERGLEQPRLTDDPGFATLARSMMRVETLSDRTDRMMVIGNPVGQHSSFWITALANRNAFHDDWVWYWRKPAWANRTELRDLSTGLDLSFLQRHGLSYVLVAVREENLIEEANRRDYLDRIYSGGPGGYAIYHVEPTSGQEPSWLTFDNGEVASLTSDPEQIVASGHSRTGGLARIAVNAYSAWRVSVNGESAEVIESREGYMFVPIPAGDVELTLTFVVEPAVWVGRALTTVGILWIAALVVSPVLFRRVRRFHAGAIPKSLR